jgi:hypothetical protein
LQGIGCGLEKIVYMIRDISSCILYECLRISFADRLLCYSVIWRICIPPQILAHPEQPVSRVLREKYNKRYFFLSDIYLIVFGTIMKIMPRDIIIRSCYILPIYKIWKYSYQEQRQRANEKTPQTVSCARFSFVHGASPGIWMLSMHRRIFLEAKVKRAFFVDVRGLILKQE